MLIIREAKIGDREKILRILKKLDLYYPALELESFFVAEKGGEIVGVVQFIEYKDYYFLSSLGVVEKAQKRGIASALVKQVIQNAGKDIYLYTVIPEFFEKFGFKKTHPLPGLPTKEHYDCAHCFPGKCATMVKKVKFS